MCNTINISLSAYIICGKLITLVSSRPVQALVEIHQVKMVVSRENGISVCIFHRLVSLYEVKVPCQDHANKCSFFTGRPLAAMDYQLVFKILILWIWYQPQYGHAESQFITTRSAEHLLSTSTEINGKWNVQCVNGVIAWRVYVVNFRDWACIQCDPSPLCIGNQQHFLDRTMKIFITILISFCPGGGLLFEYRPSGTGTLQAYNTCAIFSLRCKLIGLECCIIMNSLNTCNFPVLVLGICTIVSIHK